MNTPTVYIILVILGNIWLIKALQSPHDKNPITKLNIINKHLGKGKQLDDVQAIKSSSKVTNGSSVHRQAKFLTPFGSSGFKNNLGGFNGFGAFVQQSGYGYNNKYAIGAIGGQAYSNVGFKKGRYGAPRYGIAPTYNVQPSYIRSPHSPTYKQHSPSLPAYRNIAQPTIRNVGVPSPNYYRNLLIEQLINQRHNQLPRYPRYTVVERRGTFVQPPRPLLSQPFNSLEDDFGPNIIRIGSVMDYNYRSAKIIK